MTLNNGDRVRIVKNAYDTFGDPAEYSFEGETGRVEQVEVYPQSQEPFAYQVSLDNKAKHTFLSGGDDSFTWPFYADELEKLDA
jgi:ribosomal protein L21E